ncbi:hypothetical protein PAXRUDRAFT_361692 [Paxillus rubicundulus Ve08.2h10]|uniref:Unplaced genomic scaffold scaffold_200, whole genome shotgun sequence n=1 Tax=Paxillus rubicundulus Ve08.2h10 TaxID=930991 RepID=A0A0D0E9G1_9AGAM|nr:hypothetical protein PAXRUDRAFT_361692 [Paxillus rubicundulus Ve08.2h10]
MRLRPLLRPAHLSTSMISFLYICLLPYAFPLMPSFSSVPPFIPPMPSSLSMPPIIPPMLSFLFMPHYILYAFPCTYVFPPRPSLYAYQST